MKKLIIACLVIVIALSAFVPAFAQHGGFVSSPSLNPAPELIEGTMEGIIEGSTEGSTASEACQARLIITAYGDRDELTVEDRQEIEKAYAIIVGTPDLVSLCEDLGDVTDKIGIDAAGLAASELFDITSTDCSIHSEHGHFDITLKPESLENFVALVYYKDNEWHLVENAEVTHNGEHLEFDTDQLAPYAIIVSTEEDVDVPPVTIDDDFKLSPVAISMLALLLLILLIAIYMILKSKSKKAKAE